MAKSRVSLKLAVDRQERQTSAVGKDLVDFLFQLLSLPVATIIRLLGDEGMEGSLPKLYKSLQNLNTTYIETGKNKDTFLKPVSTSSVKLLGIYDDNARIPNNPSYMCTNTSEPHYPRESYDSPRRCPFCNEGLRLCKSVEVEEDMGLVKGVVTYMVMDDLEVKPMSTISSLTLLNQFNVKDVGDLEEKVVELGMDEGIKMLKISLQSKKVLTDVFC